jgi:hypothetical protein
MEQTLQAALTPTTDNHPQPASEAPDREPTQFELALARIQRRPQEPLESAVAPFNSAF